MRRSKGLPKLTLQEQKERHKKLFGFETHEGFLCDFFVRDYKRKVKELETYFPSDYNLRRIAEAKKELAEWEARSKLPGAY